MNNSAETNILRFIQQNRGQVFAGPELCRMIFKNKNGTTAAPKSVSRRLQELAEAKEIQVEEKNGIAHYTADESKIPMKQVLDHIEMRDGMPVAVMKMVAAL